MGLRHMHAKGQLWNSEDNLQEFVLSFIIGLLRMEACFHHLTSPLVVSFVHLLLHLYAMQMR